MKNIDLILIGNELLNGKVQDLNTKFIARTLHTNGHNLRKVHIVRDNPSDFKEALAQSEKNADIIITSGGLGPTPDDLTKTMLSEYFKKEITYNKKAQEIVEVHYKRRKKEYDSEKLHYHTTPKDFTPILNPVGLAPGLAFLATDQKKYFALPGVPREFRAMFKEEVLPHIVKNQNKRIRHIITRTKFVPESKIFTEVCPTLWTRLQTYGEVSSLPHIMGVDIGVKIISNTQEENNLKEKEILALLEDSELKDHIWHIGPESLEEVIISRAREKNIKIGFAESCTGGLLASRITDISGSSSVFWGSIVSYSNEVKTKALNVKEETLKAHGAVSKEVAMEMAQGAYTNLNLDIAITTTGIAGPGGGSEEKPVGTVGIGVKTREKEYSKLHYFQGDRETLKMKFSEFALYKLLEEILLYP